MLKINSHSKLANTVAVLTCLLAVTSLLASPRRVNAQTPTAKAAPVSPHVPTTGVMQLGRHTPTKVVKGLATRVSHYNPEQKLRLALALQPPDMAGEEKFLKDITTKGSPNFHKFLSAAEWNKRFGPSVEQEQAVVDWAKSQGLTVTNRFDNRLLVDVEAPAGVIEKAFSVTLNNYKVDDEVDFSNDRDPAVPAALGIRSVMGLNSIQRMRGFTPLARKMKGPDYVAGPVFAKGLEGHTDGDPTKAPIKGAVRSEAGRKVNADSLTPDSVTVDPSWVFDSEGYNFEALTTLAHCCNLHNDSDGAPANTSIALVSFGDFTNADVTAFFNYYGYAGYWYRYVVDGSGGQPGVECSPGASGCPTIGMDDEIPGDVEFANAALNNHGSYLDTARTFVYEGANGYYSTYADLWNFVLSNGFAKVASTSYGDAEEDYDQGGFVNGTASGDIHPIFNAMVGQGMTLIGAAGDSGSAQDCGDAVQINWPSADPDFVAAGGTGLNLDAYGNFVSETAWVGDTWSGACSDNWGGGGGGQSVYFSQPSWQNGLISGATNRLVPDISLSADPDDTWEQYYYNGGWSRFDGTSIVAPELAGFFTMENSYLDYEGNICGSGSSACTPIGNPNQFVYDAGRYSGPHNPFYDVTTGCNSNDITAYYGLATFCAGTGYDQATGWGSFNAMQLSWDINWFLIPAVGTPSISFTGPTTGSTWYNSNQQVDWTVSDSGGGYPAPGVAGFTQGWDTIPADPTSEPHGGSGNSYYSGPEYPFATGGCLAFDNNGCAGGSGQGCHTVVVEAWDNQGRTATQSYGPLCYDDIAPLISISNNPGANANGWNNGNVTITLAATDPGAGSTGSGIAHTYYAIDTGACYPGNVSACTVYTGPFVQSTVGSHYIYYFTVDNAGNSSAEPYEYVNIDTTPPTTTAGLTGTVYSGSIYDSAVKVTLTGSDATSGVQYTYYQLDGGATTTYGSAFTVSTLGAHTVKYWSVDNAGNTETAHSVSFTIESLTNAALVATPNPSVNGQSVTMKATITSQLAGAGTPTGSVIFYNGSTNLGTVTLTSGVASLSTTSLPVGALTLQVTYTPTGNYITANSAPFDQTVQETTTTSVTPSTNPTPYGKSVTLTAKVTPSISGTPTGTVSFLSGTTLLGTGTLSSGTATLATTALPLGSDSITAKYNGNSTYVTSTSVAFAETVTVAATTTTLASSQNPVVIAHSVTFTATVSSTGTPTGSVTFKSNGTTLGSATLSGGVASYSTTSLAAGTDSITAVYAGSTDYQTSTSSTLSEVVNEPPAVTLSPTSLAFGNEQIGSATVSKTVTLTNSGSGPLTITSITVTGSGASSFAFANTCGTTIAAGGTCTIHGHFEPTVAGPLTAAVTLVDNAQNSPQSIALSGIGGVPVVSLSPTSLAFGSEQVGSSTSSQTVTLTNTGNATLTITSIAVTGANASSYVFGNTCSSVAVGANCTIHGHFTPTVAGSLPAAITITDNASGGTQTIALSGTGSNGTTISLSATSVAFGDETVGSESPLHTVVLTNTGSSTLTISSIALTGTNATSFLTSNTCGSSVAVGATCNLNLRFDPKATGAATAALTLTDNASGSPQSIALSGTGQ